MYSLSRELSEFVRSYKDSLRSSFKLKSFERSQSKRSGKTSEEK